MELVLIITDNDHIAWQGQSPYDLAKQKKSKWILMQMDLLARDKGDGKPAFLQSLTKDKVGWHIATDVLMNKT